MTDFTLDIHEAVDKLTRLKLRELGAEALLARFMAEPWTVRLVDGRYVVTFDLDGSELGSLSVDDVAWAVGNIRAHRGDPAPTLVN